MSPRKYTVLFVILTVVLTASADTVIYDNLGSATAGSDPFSSFPGNRAFNSFSTGASGLVLTEVILKLNGDGASSTSSGSITVTLLSDSPYLSGFTCFVDSGDYVCPGTILYTIGSLADASLSSTLTDYSFPLVSPFALSGNTRYWIVVTSTANSTAYWAWSSDQTALGVAGEFAGWGGPDASGVFSNAYGGPYQMKLLGSAQVTEPGSLLLVASGFGAAVLRRRSVRERQRDQ